MGDSPEAEPPAELAESTAEALVEVALEAAVEAAVEAEAELPTQRQVRRQCGKEVRLSSPRSSHTVTGKDDPGRDPLALLEESNHDRLETLLPIRFTRMLESSFAFFRGSAVLQAYDLAQVPSTGITVQCCGDCHVMNFGGFATPERTLTFDINDFDETHPAPFEWDLKRLVTSFILAARWLRFSDAEAKSAAKSAATAYRNATARFAEMSVLDTWYSQVKFDDLLSSDTIHPTFQKHLRKRMRQARINTSDHVFEKITTVVDGQPRIVVQPPLLFRSDEFDEYWKFEVVPFFESYRGTLSRDRQILFDHYHLVDAVHKVVGVGSVGTRCFIALMMGDHGDPLFLQVKEARPSVLKWNVGVPYTNHGERVVAGQRLMQTASDIFLGWSRGPNGHDYYVRQLRDMKVSPDLRSSSPEILSAYGQLCGKILARAHAKSGNAAMVTGYLGASDKFDKVLTRYAVAYADQVERDYETFRSAVRTGRFPVETLPSEIEEAIR